MSFATKLWWIMMRLSVVIHSLFFMPQCIMLRPVKHESIHSPPTSSESSPGFPRRTALPAHRRQVISSPSLAVFRIRNGLEYTLQVIRNPQKMCTGPNYHNPVTYLAVHKQGNPNMLINSHSYIGYTNSGILSSEFPEYNAPAFLFWSSTA